MNIVDKNFDITLKSAVANILAMGDEYRSLAKLVQQVGESDSITIRQLIVLNEVMEDWSDQESMQQSQA